LSENNKESGGASPAVFFILTQICQPVGLANLG